MAPQNKRQNATKTSVAAKKAKVEKAEKVETKLEDPIIAQLEPIVDALGSSKLPASCQELLRTALPHCMGGAVEERHAYQLQMLELATAALEADVADKRACLETTEQKVSQLQAELVASKADVEAAKSAASNKKEELQRKNEEVSEATTEVQSANEGVESEIKRKEIFLTEKAAIQAEQEAFQNVLTGLWDPLKSSSFAPQQYRKRDKVILELIEKLQPLEIEECLLDAVTAALKLKQHNRTEFAEKVFQFMERAYEKQQSLLAERVAGTSTQEQEHEKAIVDAESKHAETKAKLADREKEHQSLENEWVELESDAKNAIDIESDFVNNLEVARADNQMDKERLHSALGIAESFAQLKDPKKEPLVEVTSVSAPVDLVHLDATPNRDLDATLNRDTESAEGAEAVVAA
jgi:chromosome segregation ATPase